MAEPDWRQAEEQLFERSGATLRCFGREHPDEPISLFAYTVDSLFAGVGLNFDSLSNSLAQAQDHQRREVRDRNRLLTADEGWQIARHLVTDPTRQIDDFNRHGPLSYELVDFVPLTAWEECFGELGAEDDEAGSDLEGRVITSLWRVVDRLVTAQAFDGLRCASPLRIGFAFHDEELVLLRVLNWPASMSENR